MSAEVAEGARLPPQEAEATAEESKNGSTPPAEDLESPDEEKERQDSGQDDDTSDEGETSAPPLPEEEGPPLPNEAPPGQVKDDGWDPVWDDNAQAFYFYNRFTGISQWENPRVPVAESGPPGVGNHERIPSNGPETKRPTGGYDPTIHGDYDPNADYAQEGNLNSSADPSALPSDDPNLIYTATGTFNRFTGKWQSAALQPENFNDENKSKRQMNAFFDVDAAANSHDGKSLKAERSGKKLTKKELKAFKDKRREKKEEKRRAWLRD